MADEDTEAEVRAEDRAVHQSKVLVLVQASKWPLV
jgi:hypothetical protein